ncbi:MAG: hypothetical protein ACYDHD_01680 [Vulcanimicrobiaceae bacterium]
MNAIEARKARRVAGKRTLSARLREEAGMARQIDAYVKELRLAQQCLDALHQYDPAKRP